MSEAVHRSGTLVSNRIPKGSWVTIRRMYGGSPAGSPAAWYRPEKRTPVGVLGVDAV